MQSIMQYCRRSILTARNKLSALVIIGVRNPVHVLDNIQATLCNFFPVSRHRKVGWVADGGLPIYRPHICPGVQIITGAFLYQAVAVLRNNAVPVHGYVVLIQSSGVRKRNLLPDCHLPRERRLVNDFIDPAGGKYIRPCTGRRK